MKKTETGSKIIFENIQIRSVEKAKKFAMLLEILDEHYCVHKTKVTIKNSFICGWIDTKVLSKTDMEKLLAVIINDHGQG